MTPSRKRQGTPAKLLRITQIRSRIGNQERVVKVLTDGLGLGRIGSTVVLPDNGYTRGMILRVAHMVRVEEVAGDVAAN
ncbi:MAG: 50S ribosomal protein L30 [Acidobacteriota bacterium]|jgi:large subunit ribosomal protein L30